MRLAVAILVCVVMNPCERTQAMLAKEVYAKTADRSGIVLGRVSEQHGVDILTNYHVINGSSLIRITTKHGETFKTNVLYFDALKDTALIRVESQRTETRTGGTRFESDK